MMTVPCKAIRIVAILLVVCVVTATAPLQLYALAPKSIFENGNLDDKAIKLSQTHAVQENRSNQTWDPVSEKAIGRLETLLDDIHQRHMNRFALAMIALSIFTPSLFVVMGKITAVLAHIPIVAGVTASTAVYFYLWHRFDRLAIIPEWLISYFMSWAMPERMIQEIHLTAGMFLSVQNKSMTEESLRKIMKIALSRRTVGEMELWKMTLRAIEVERRKMERLERLLSRIKATCLRTAMSDWLDFIGIIPYAHRYAAYALTEGRDKVPAHHLLMCQNYLDRQAEMGSIPAKLLLAEIVAANPMLAQNIHSVQQAMIDRAMEGNPYIRTVLSDLGSLKTISAKPESLGELKLSEQNSLDILPFDLSEKGRLFFSELFKIDAGAAKVSLITIHAEASHIAIPFAFVLKDTQSKAVYHLQVLNLSYGFVNRDARGIRFPPYHMPEYDGLFWDFTLRLLKTYGPGYTVEGAAFRLSRKWIRLYEEEKALHSHEKIEREAAIMYLVQPEDLEAQQKAPAGMSLVGLMEAGAKNYDKQILFNPHSLFHFAVMGAVDRMAERELIKDKDIGVIGTGQGTDIIQILHHRPHSIRANDILPVAVIVSRWNLQIAQEIGLAPKDIPVEINIGSGVHGIGNPQAIVWHMPVITPDDAVQDNTRPPDFADQHQTTAFHLGETDYRDFLNELSSLLSAPEKFAVLRLNMDRRLHKGVSHDAAILRSLREANLKGKPILPSETGMHTLWEVRRGVGITDLAIASDTLSSNAA